jgi:hypothetical protein
VLDSPLSDSRVAHGTGFCISWFSIFVKSFNVNFKGLVFLLQLNQSSDFSMKKNAMIEPNIVSKTRLNGVSFAVTIFRNRENIPFAISYFCPY